MKFKCPGCESVLEGQPNTNYNLDCQVCGKPARATLQNTVLICQGCGDKQVILDGEEFYTACPKCRFKVFQVAVMDGEFIVEDPNKKELVPDKGEEVEVPSDPKADKREDPPPQETREEKVERLTKELTETLSAKSRKEIKQYIEERKDIMGDDYSIRGKRKEIIIKDIIEKFSKAI